MHIWLQFSTRCRLRGWELRPHRRFQGGRGLSRACAGRMDTRDCVRGYPLLENRGQTRANRRYSVVEGVGVGSSLSTDFFIAFSHNAMNWDYAVSWFRAHARGLFLEPKRDSRRRSDHRISSICLNSRVFFQQGARFARVSGVLAACRQKGGVIWR